MKRKANDFYPTPPEVIDALLDNYEIGGANTKILEPCAGDGQIIKSLKKNGYEKIKAVEIREEESEKLNELVGYGNFAITDYLKVNKKFLKEPDVIITNPPFSLAMEFIVKSLEDVTKDGKVIMLLRLGFLASKTRYKFMKENPPTDIYVLHKRPSFTGAGTDSQEYAWFVWDKAKTEQTLKVI